MKKLHQKLQVIKATIGAVSKTKENPFFKSQYFDINELLDQLHPLFEEQGVLCLQPIMGNHVITKLIDIETGEEEMSAMELPALTDPQKMGSAVTYLRRYTLQSLLALQAEDDDGNKASQETKKEWLTKAQFDKAMEATSDQIRNVLKVYTTNGKAMKKEYRQLLEAQLEHLEEEKNVNV